MAASDLVWPSNLPFRAAGPFDCELGLPGNPRNFVGEDFPLDSGPSDAIR